MITANDILAEGSTWERSLAKLIGKRVVDIRGYISDPWGAGAVFVVTEAVFEDGTTIGFEGEHDCPYLAAYRSEPQPNYDQETLDRLYREASE